MHIKYAVLLVVLMLLVPITEMGKRDYIRSVSADNEYSKYFWEANKKGYMTQSEMDTLATLSGPSEELIDELSRKSTMIDAGVLITYALFIMFFYRRSKLYALAIALGYVAMKLMY